MRRKRAALLALALVACGNTNADDERWCRELYARTNLSNFVNPKTGKLMRDPKTNEVLNPQTYRVALTRKEEACITREAQKAIDAYEGR
jgi:hypothetical protein